MILLGFILSVLMNPQMHSGEAIAGPAMIDHNKESLPWWLSHVADFLLPHAQQRNRESLRRNMENGVFERALASEPDANLEQIKHADLLASGKFIGNHLKRSVPLVITDVASKWSAMTRWGTEFFKEEMGNLQVFSDGLLHGLSIQINRTHMVKGRRTPMLFKEFIERIKTQPSRPRDQDLKKIISDPWLLLSSSNIPDDQLYWTLDGKNMSNMYPEILADAGIPELLLFPEDTELYKLNLWLSSYKYTPPHYDNSDNILLQVAGEKLVRLWPPILDTLDRIQPRMLRQLHPGHYGLNEPPKWDFVFATDIFADPIHEVTLRPGQALFIPRGYYHAVESTTITGDGVTLPDINVAVNYWFKSEPSMEYAYKMTLEQLKIFTTRAQSADPMVPGGFLHWQQKQAAKETKIAERKKKRRRDKSNHASKRKRRMKSRKVETSREL